MEWTYTSEYICTPERMWPFLTKSRYWPQWMREVRTVHLADGAKKFEAGVEFTLQTRLRARDLEVNGRITTLEASHALALELQSPGAITEADYRLIDLRGRTRLDVVTRIQPRPGNATSEQRQPWLWLLRWRQHRDLQRLRLLAESPLRSPTL